MTTAQPTSTSMIGVDLGLFLMPSHPPERSVVEGNRWDLSVIQAADRLGYKEAWIGEHLNTPWEPCPAPELVVAQALMCTEQIRLGPGAHILPNHSPARLAHQVAYLDHLAEGRYLLGIGAGGGGSPLFGYADAARQQRYAHVRESLEIMIKLWTEPGPWEFTGSNWTVTKPAVSGDPNAPQGVDLLPYQRPHPPIGIAGLSAESEMLRFAGEIGAIGMSLYLNDAGLRRNWAIYEEGATTTDLAPDRRQWRIAKDVFIADSDEEARRRSAGSIMGRMSRDYLLPLYSKSGRLGDLKYDEAMPDGDVTTEYRAGHEWLVGSPETVAEKLATLHHEVGGFGTLLVVGHDYADEPGPWMESLERLATEVLPKVNQWITGAPRHP